MQENEWLHSEILSSLTGDIISKASDERCYDVRLIVNGVEVSPTLLNHVADNLDAHIQEAAKQLIRERLEAAESKANELLSFVQVVSDNLKSQFGLYASEVE